MPHNCPVCHQQLMVASYRGGIVVWCANGPCRSIAANDGAEGVTEAEAFANLQKAIDKEIQNGDSQSPTQE